LCPDCGGILEPIHPPWLAAIDLVSAAATNDPTPPDRRCLLCGYHESFERPGSGAVALPDPRGRW
jgi:hypothetical protein